MTCCARPYTVQRQAANQDSQSGRDGGAQPGGACPARAETPGEPNGRAARAAGLDEREIDRTIASAQQTAGREASRPFEHSAAHVTSAASCSPKLRLRMHASGTPGREACKRKLSDAAGHWPLSGNPRRITTRRRDSERATSTIGRITTSVTPQIRKQAPATGAHGNRVAITGHNIRLQPRSAFDGTPRGNGGTPDTATKNDWFTVTPDRPRHQ